LPWPAVRAWAPADRQGKRQAGDRRRLQPEPPVSRQHPDLDGQARRQRRVRLLHANEERHWKAGVTAKGLKEGGVDWALDENNRKLITPEIEKRVTGARKDIIDGKVKVIDIRSAQPARSKSTKRAAGAFPRAARFTF
jgi:hypothetical protein